MDEWEFADEVDVLAKLPANFDELRESKKWQERKEALDILVTLLEPTVRLSTKSSYGEILGNLQTMIPIVFEKLKEKKPLLRDPLVECADAIASTIPSLEAIIEEIEEIMKKQNPQIKQQVDNFLCRQLNMITPDKAPKKLIKAVVPLLIKHSCDADQDVRDSSLSAIGCIQRLIGDRNIRSMIGELSNDEMKMKKIEEYAARASQAHSEEIAKQQSNVCPVVQEKGGFSDSECGTHTSVSAEGVPAPVKEVDPWDFLEAVDVLAKLPADFNTNIESKKWTERRDALQAFLDLLIMNPKLDPKVSYGEPVALLKHIIEKDANINVAALAAKCMKGLAEGLRKKFVPHVASVLPVIFDRFKEKKPLLRDPLIECIDAIAATTTLEAMGEDIIVALEKPNPSIKIQTNLFLYRSFKQLNAQTMPRKTIKSLIPLLIKVVYTWTYVGFFLKFVIHDQHSGDSDAEVRDASYAALGSAMRAIGEKLCLPLLSDILEDKLKMAKIKEFYQKACEEAGPEVITQMVQSIHKADVAPSKDLELSGKKDATLTRDSSVEHRSASAQEEEQDDDEALKPPSGATLTRKTLEKKKEVAKKVEEEEVLVKKSSEELLLSATDEKQQRLKDERSLKALKWNFTLPTEEHVTQLQDQIGRVSKASLMGLLFNKDFKQHLKAIELLNKTGCEACWAAETNPETLVKNSDLLLKWCTLRFYETNPAVLIKVLEFAKQVLVLVRSFDEPMSSEEMYAFMPHLLLKSGEQKESMRNAVQALKTKNARQRAECLQVLEQYIARAGLVQLKSLGIHKAIAACVSDRDNNVRNAAINGLVACYRDEGDQMWRNVGKIGDKERAMVEERIKRSGVAPGINGTRSNVPGSVKAGAKIVVPQRG
ncbi:HEAT repeat protein [Dictyocaulus viviparus]|uniref:HEAT repeat protein n=1 Tax=Dictyocaulus viviparus TaxID=29172 RepID=A0A0D8XIP8_DICVI|nr:HEAT repeat protein [Dictyocaulus viviparus]